MGTLSHASKIWLCVALAALTAAGYWAGSATATPTCDEDCRVTCVLWVSGMNFAKLNYFYASTTPCGILHYSEEDYHYYVIDGPTLATVLNSQSGGSSHDCSHLTALTYHKIRPQNCSSTGNYVAALCYECSDVPVTE